MHQAWGWAGIVGDFLVLDEPDFLSALERHHESLLGKNASQDTLQAWREERETLRSALESCVQENPDADRWGIVFEYELPLEGGRRPDAVILTGGSVHVLEFKSAPRVLPEDVDQARAYGRDLIEYHEGCRGHSVHSLLVLPRAEPSLYLDSDGVAIVGTESLAKQLLAGASAGRLKLDAWLRSRYVPLPTLVAAARRLFNEHDQPHIWRAVSERIPKTVDFLKSVAEEAKRDGRRSIAFVTGVPGAGKTLVGLRLVYERSGLGSDAMFLSGNTFLIQVLQDALQSKVVVSDLHKFVQGYGIRELAPSHNLAVFDEAQRLWDASYMKSKGKGELSEPQYLVKIGERMAGWCLLVALIGEGQSIFSGEEGGVEAWRQAVHGTEMSGWDIYAPPHLEPDLAGLPLSLKEELHLDVSLRMRRADLVHEWVQLLLAGSLELAARRASQFRRDGFEMYVTRDLDRAKRYARDRYAGEPHARYGLLAYSKATTPRNYGVDNYFRSGQRALQRQGIGRWYNAPQDDERSCCSFHLPATEFHCQGLELDMPIMCWGEEMLWGSTDGWIRRPGRTQYPLEDPEEVLDNTYRVLLTRGRDGVVIWVPPEPGFDSTVDALRGAGMVELPDFIADVAAVEAAR